MGFYCVSRIRNSIIIKRGTNFPSLSWELRMAKMLKITQTLYFITHLCLELDSWSHTYTRYTLSPVLSISVDGKVIFPVSQNTWESFIGSSMTSHYVVLLSGSFNKCLYFSLTQPFVSKLLYCVIGEQIQLQFVNKFNQWYGNRAKSKFP